MATPSPPLLDVVWTAELASLLEEAALAIGRLDARFSASPAQLAWTERASWAGFAAARQGQGAELDEIDIFALACRIPLPRRRPLPFAEDEAQALAGWQASLTHRTRPHWRELIPVTLDLPPDWRDRPALLRALALTAAYARADRGPAPWLTQPALLAALGITQARLPCLVAPDKALRLAPRDPGIVRRSLKQLAKAATDGHAQLVAMEADRRRAAAVLAAQHRPGALVALVALLQRRPLLSPAGVAQALGVGISGAGKLLGRAAALGLLVEISGRQSWRAYLVPDLAVRFGFITAPRGRPRAVPPPSEPIDQLLARFDAEMAAFDARFAPGAEVRETLED